MQFQWTNFQKGTAFAATYTMKFTYKHTMRTCYLAYITGAVINNLAPLLFVTFSETFGLHLEQLALIITMNFGIQMIVDFIGAKFADRIGYKPLIMTSQIFSALGLVALGVLPRLLPSPYIGIILAAVLYAVGSGLMEVLISPIIEALPGDAKASSMSLLHSFYCWGHVLTVVVSTLFFRVFGIENWSVLCILWAILPVVTFFLFYLVPINQLGAEGEESQPLRKLFSVKILWLFLILMLCAGAAEQSMSQWSSFFAETELGVSKQMADLLGPCMFAITMGLSRVLFAAVGKRLDIRTGLVGSAVLCIASYLLAAYGPHPLLALAGCALCGFSVGMMWPGVLSLSAKTYAAGGTAMFALLALAGDVGCFVGPEVVARTASASATCGAQSVKAGLVFAIVFPLFILLAVAVLALRGKKRER